MNYSTTYDESGQKMRDISPTPFTQQALPAASSPSSEPPPLSPVRKRRRAGALRTGVMAALTLLLAVIFGVGLFAGWQFGRTSTVAAGARSANTSTAVQATSTVETAQEAAIARVKAAVVEVKVTTQ